MIFSRKTLVVNNTIPLVSSLSQTETGTAEVFGRKGRVAVHVCHYPKIRWQKGESTPHGVSKAFSPAVAAVPVAGCPLACASMTDQPAANHPERES